MFRLALVVSLVFVLTGCGGTYLHTPIEFKNKIKGNQNSLADKETALFKTGTSYRRIAKPNDQLVFRRKIECPKLEQKDFFNGKRVFMEYACRVRATKKSMIYSCQEQELQLVGTGLLNIFLGAYTSAVFAPGSYTHSQIKNRVPNDMSYIENGLEKCALDDIEALKSKEIH
jgi:hypothetical protein